MIRCKSLLAGVAVMALLVLASGTDAAPRYKRLGHKLHPPGKPLPASVTEVIKKEFPTGKITGAWMEEKGELEVFVSVPGCPSIEVVFKRKDSKDMWHLVGYEEPVPAAALTPRACHSLHEKYKSAKILEVEMVFNATWGFLGYQVTIQEGGKSHEVFIKANGSFATDPL